MKSFYLKRAAILLLICSALFIFGNNIFSLTDPDEAFYSLTAHEMTSHNEWLVPMIFDKPQFEKPPLTYWLLELAFRAWGEGAFTARLFPAIFAGLGVLAVYFLGLTGFKDERKAFLSAIVLATCGFYLSMGKMVFTDMIFAVFILGAFMMFVLGFMDRRQHAVGIVGFYIFCALATITKTPLGWFIPQAAVVLFLLYRRQISFLATEWVAIGFLVYLVIALPWYWYIYNRFGGAFIHEFFYNDHWRRLLEAEHKANDTWFFYPMTMIGGLFPWSLFLIAALVDLFKRLKSSVTVMDYLCLSWVLAVLVVFQSAHSKLTSYILPLFPALALITGDFLGNGLSHIQLRRKMQNLLYASFGTLVIFAIVVVAAHKVYHHYISSPEPMYFLSGFLIVLAGFGTTLVFKDFLEESLYVLAMTMVPIFLTAFLVHTNVEGYVSSHEASEYIPQRSPQTLTVLTSKNDARGIRYFTGQKVAVVDFGDKPFFSPHPIPILNTMDEIKGVLSQQAVTFGVLRKSAYQAILKQAKGYHVALLGIAGYDYIVRIEALKHP